MFIQVQPKTRDPHTGKPVLPVILNTNYINGVIQLHSEGLPEARQGSRIHLSHSIVTSIDVVENQDEIFRLVNFDGHLFSVSKSPNTD